MDEHLTEYIIKAQSGDKNAFEQIVYIFEKSVYNISYKMIRNSQDAKEITQEVFIKVFLNIKKFQGTASFKTWLYRIAVNTTLDEIKKRKKNEYISFDERFETDDGSISSQFEDISAKQPIDEVLRNEKRQNIITAINKLPKEHQDVIIYREIMGYSYEEIACTLQINEGTVKSRISRARHRFKNIYLDLEQYKDDISQTNMKGGATDGV